MESRRRSTRPPVPPSTESGGSLPRLIVSASNLRFAPRSLVWSKTTVPCTRDRVGRICAVAHDLDGARTPIGPVKSTGPRRSNIHWIVALPRIAHPRRDTAKNGGGMWPQCGAGRGNAQREDGIPHEAAPRLSPAEIAGFALIHRALF